MRLLKKTIHSTQKRSFLLFELLLSLALLTLCLFPLLKPHITINRDQREKLERIQLERISKGAFCEIKERLHTQEWSWQHLLKGISGELSESPPVYSGQKRFHKYQPRYSLKKIDHSTTQNGALLLEAKIYFPSINGKRDIGPFSHIFFLKGKKHS